MSNRPKNHEIRHPRWSSVALVALTGFLWGCKLEHEVDVKPTHHTVKIEPIYMTVDINLRVQRELDAFYSDVVSDAGTTESEDPSKQGEES